MTNRRKLGVEMLTMDTERFKELLREGPLFDRLNDIMCRECEKKHGDCPAMYNEDCTVDLDEWLEEECTVETILGE